MDNTNTRSDNQIDTASSYISFDHNPLSESENYTGVAFIVSNDYHGEPGCTLRDYGLDFKNMKHVFDNLVDKYHVTVAHSATYSKFIATCKYLADYKPEYPKCCKRIIIYFSGHGGDGYIRMERDAMHPDRSNVKIIEILNFFRNDKCKDMERILLLDACCSAEDIECEGNELVACATSKGRPAESFPWTGGLWTKKFGIFLIKS